MYKYFKFTIHITLNLSLSCLLVIEANLDFTWSKVEPTTCIEQVIYKHIHLVFY